MIDSNKRGRRRTRLLQHTGILIGVGCLIALLAVTVQPLSHINWWLSDQLVLPESPSPNIVVVGIDDETLKTYGKWSEWQRRLHAQAINNLSQAGAKVIGFDVLFADSSADDSILADAIGKAGNVVLPVAGTKLVPPVESEVTFSAFVTPQASLSKGALSLGHGNVAPDADGVVRHLALTARNDAGQSYPAFALALLYGHFTKQLPQQLPFSDGHLRALDRNVPVDGLRNLRVNFAPGKEGYTTLSYGDVIKGNFDPSVVKHKMVLVGMTATGDVDTWNTPISSGKVPGVLIHACAADTILTQRFLNEAGWRTTLLTILLLTAILGLALPRLRLLWGAMLTLVLFIAYVAAVVVAFDKGNVLNVLYPLAAPPLLFFANVICVVTAEQSDRRLIRDLFGRYVSHQVATEIITLADSGKLQLGGESRIVTALFADMRGFTQATEKSPPEQIVATLNKYLSAVVECILANDGMVNKFAGDNVMAVWNAPQHQTEHARLGLKAAWEAQQAIADLKQNEPDLPPLQFGIGVNSGEAIAGNVGSVGRVEYTVIGDAVNLASRICGAAPGGEVWIGNETYELTKDDAEVEALGPQQFKGKTKPVLVYRVLGLKSK